MWRQSRCDSITALQPTKRPLSSLTPLCHGEPDGGRPQAETEPKERFPESTPLQRALQGRVRAARDGGNDAKAGRPVTLESVLVMMPHASALASLPAARAGPGIEIAV